MHPLGKTRSHQAPAITDPGRWPAVGIVVADRSHAVACLDRALSVAQKKGQPQLVVIGLPLGLSVLHFGAAWNGIAAAAIRDSIGSAAELARSIASATPREFAVAHFAVRGWRDPVLLNRLRRGDCDPLVAHRSLLSPRNRRVVSSALARCGAELMVCD
jgi:hypothetical protein